MATNMSRRRSLLEQFEQVEETRPAVDMELFLEHVGQFGLWQKKMFVFALIVAATPGFITMSATFVAFVPNVYRCRVPQCDSEQGLFQDYKNFKYALPEGNPLDASDNLREDFACFKRKFIEKAENDVLKSEKCEESNFAEDLETCSEYVYESQYDYSLIMQLNMAPLCPDPNWPFGGAVSRQALMGMAYMSGMMVGAYVFGLLADGIGRKKALLAAIAESALFMILGSFLGDNYVFYVLCRTLTGAGSKGIFALAFTLGIELTGIKYRGRVGFLLQVGFSIGAAIVGILGYFIQHWQILELTAAAIVLIFGFIFTILMSESPRWLIAKHRDSEAKKLLLKGAEINGSEVPKELIFCKHFERNQKHVEEPLGVGSLFSTNMMRRNSLVLIFNWIAATASYYGLTMGSTTLLPGNIYLNFLLSALIEVPSYLIVFFVIDRLGRKTILVSTSVVSGISCILAGSLVTTAAPLALVLSLLGKFCTTAGFGMLFLYTAELYPTSIRSTAVGMCGTFSRLGGILAPFLASLQPPILPLAIIGVMAITAGLLLLLLPETLGFPLPETIEEVKLLFENDSNFFALRSKGELKEVERDRQIALQEKHDRIKHYYMASLVNDEVSQRFEGENGDNNNNNNNDNYVNNENEKQEGMINAKNIQNAPSIVVTDETEQQMMDDVLNSAITEDAKVESTHSDEVDHKASEEDEGRGDNVKDEIAKEERNKVGKEDKELAADEKDDKIGTIDDDEAESGENNNNNNENFSNDNEEEMESKENEDTSNFEDNHDKFGNNENNDNKSNIDDDKSNNDDESYNDDESNNNDDNDTNNKVLEVTNMSMDKEELKEAMESADNVLPMNPRASPLMVATTAKSRKFSQLAPAPINSPQAVKVGSKFTAISRERE